MNAKINLKNGDWGHYVGHYAGVIMLVLELDDFSFFAKSPPPHKHLMASL